MKKYFFNILYGAVCSLVCLSCSNEEEQLNNIDLVFHDSKPIHVLPYTYPDELQNSILIQGDTTYFTGVTDTVNNKPEFQWEEIEYGAITTVAVFKLPITVTSSQISNVNDIVWQWHSDMELGMDTKVKYLEGKNVINGSIDYNQTPSPLVSGKYYWAVWKWDSDGVKIVYSSRQQTFYVKE